MPTINGAGCALDATRKLHTNPRIMQSWRSIGKLYAVRVGLSKDVKPQDKTGILCRARVQYVMQDQAWSIIDAISICRTEAVMQLLASMIVFSQVSKTHKGLSKKQRKTCMHR